MALAEMKNSKDQKYPIDSDWFFARLHASKKSMRALARYLELDASAVSRMLSGTRQMKVEEEDKIARFLGVRPEDIVAHRGAANLGFAEMAQAEFESTVAASAAKARQPSLVEPSQAADAPPKRHPAWGSMKGTTIVMPGVDLTEPTDPDWGKVHDG
ncbi:MAG: helix-turn-helix transcriptional regulator [Devosia sp.]|nr:helix-turn-helix transcriptional regulator [Devosia sp.]